MPYGCDRDPTYDGDWSAYTTPGTRVERSANGEVTRISRYSFGNNIPFASGGPKEALDDIKTQVHTAAELDDIAALEGCIAADPYCVVAADRERRGRTPLHSAALGGSLEAIELLLKRGAKVNATAAGGGTPLHYAARYGKTTATALLLSRGADHTARDDSGDTPLDDAVKRGHDEIASEIQRSSGLSAAPAEESCTASQLEQAEHSIRTIMNGLPPAAQSQVLSRLGLEYKKKSDTEK